MTQRHGHFGKFEPHTLVKHAILKSYLAAWAMKFLLWGEAGSHLVIVDAFAGQGRDAAGNEGSPLIAARCAVEAIEAVRRGRPHLNPTVRIYAIERDPRNFGLLERALASVQSEHPGLVVVLRGELSDHIERLHREIQSAPTFAFLDPYGIAGLDAATYGPMLAGNHNEMFVLFSNIGAARLHGLVTRPRADATSAIAEIESMPSLFPEYDDAAKDAAVTAAERTNEALDLSVPASREYLMRAFGGESWVGCIESNTTQSRVDAFLGLFQEALVRAGAGYVLTVPMRNEAGRPVYALVHGSKSAVALVTMKESVSAALRKDLLSDAVRDQMKSDLAVDIPGVVDWLSQAFSGRQVPWAAEPDGIKAIALRHTAMFHLQNEALKTALRKNGVLRKVGRKDICFFPAQSDLTRGSGS